MLKAILWQMKLSSSKYGHYNYKERRIQMIVLNGMVFYEKITCKLN